jgi:hypothetical protein
MKVWFKMSTYESFMRQLNLYGFRRIPKEKCTYYHPCFQRDHHDLLPSILRCTYKGTGPRKPDSQMAVPAFAQTNEASKSEGGHAVANSRQKIEKAPGQEISPITVVNSLVPDKSGANWFGIEDSDPRKSHELDEDESLHNELMNEPIIGACPWQKFQNDVFDLEFGDDDPWLISQILSDSAANANDLLDPLSQ